MPADYKSAAAALSLSPSPVNTPTSPRHGDSDDEDHGESSPAPPWVRTRPSVSARRLSTRPFNPNRRASSTQNRSFVTQLIRTGEQTTRWALKLFYRLSPLQRVLVVVALVAVFILSILALVYSHKIFGWLGPVSTKWRALPGGWLIVWFLTFGTAFPPMIGYSTACTVAGFVYGFPLGWPIVATASVAGSLAAFVTSRTVFSGYVDRLVGHDKRFQALGHVLRHDGLVVLALIRFCPLPYSLSNGFLATIPNIHPGAFALATALSSPKLLVHVFIGSRLALLAEKGDTMSGGDRAINYVSMAVGGLVGATVGYVIYRRTMARAAELAREEDPEAAAAAARAGLPGAGDYADSEEEEDARLMDPNDADAAALMDDDDISLWDNTDGVEGGGYRDSFTDEDGTSQGKAQRK